MTLDTINHHVRVAKYAVRGELVIRAMGYEQKLAAKDASVPFKELIYCNIGNPQQLGQQPLTFFRQVLAACEYPPLIKEEVLLGSGGGCLNRSITLKRSAHYL